MLMRGITLLVWLAARPRLSPSLPNFLRATMTRLAPAASLPAFAVAIVMALPAGEAPRPLAAGMILLPRARVSTAESGRATLTRNGDVVEVAPGSALELPADATGRPLKGVVQTLGSLLYKIVTRPEDPFRVDTPYLAALVKGTVFYVVVTANGTQLRVDRGAVEVTARRNRDRSVVRAGQTAFAAARSGPGLRITGKPTEQSSENTPANGANGQRAEASGGSNVASDILPPDLEIVARAAAGHPEPGIARAQVETLIADHPAQAIEIAIAAVRVRPEIAAAVARAAARARPDRATEVVAVIGALAPGQGVGAGGLGDLDQSAGGPMNFGAGPAGGRPSTSGDSAQSHPSENKRLPAITLPGPSISGP
jgi:hypothetical protein